MAIIRIVEADPETRTLLEILLTRLGHTADDAAPPDVALVEPAGPDAADAVRDLRAAHPDVPVVAVTVLPPSRSLAAWRIARHVEKPISGRKLAEAIDAALASAPGRAGDPR